MAEIAGMNPVNPSLERVLTPEEVTWAQICAKAGDRPEEISTELGVSIERIRQLLPVKELTARQAEAVSLWSCGCSHTEIGQEMRLANSSVRKLLARARSAGYDVETLGSRRAARAMSIFKQLSLGKKREDVAQMHNISCTTLERIIQNVKHQHDVRSISNICRLLPSVGPPAAPSNVA